MTANTYKANIHYYTKYLRRLRSEPKPNHTKISNALDAKDSNIKAYLKLTGELYTGE